MSGFLSQSLYLLTFLKEISKSQIFNKDGPFKLKIHQKYIAKFICFIFYPYSLITSTRPFEIRLQNCLASLGPIFIKFGQTLSTRPDIVGDNLAFALQGLQDRLPAFAYEIVARAVNESFKADINDIFLTFDKLSVSAASIAQVHKAQLYNKQFVAVKILRPNIKKDYNKGIKLLELLIKIFGKLSKRFKRFEAHKLVDIFKINMMHELDLRNEAAATSQVQDNFIADLDLCVPQIHWQYVSYNVMVSQWLDGYSLYDLPSSMDRKEIAKKIAGIFFNQAFRDGFFHADLHPGNIIINQYEKIALIDYGITAHLPEKDRFAVAKILAATLQKDYKKIAQLHIEAGYVPENINKYLFKERCRLIIEPLVTGRKHKTQIGELITGLLSIAEEFGMTVQPQLFMLQKTIIMVEGLGNMLDPDCDIWLLCSPLINKWAAKNLSPEAQMLRIGKRLFDKYIKNQLI